MNHHNDTCEFYNHFYKNYQYKDDSTEKSPKHVCCCRDDKFPHYEDIKFTIIDEKNKEELLKTPIYYKFNPGELVDD